MSSRRKIPSPNNLIVLNFELPQTTDIHSFIPAISIAPLQVLYYSEALPTTARILYRSFTPKRTPLRLKAIDSTKAPPCPTLSIFYGQRGNKRAVCNIIGQNSYLTNMNF